MNSMDKKLKSTLYRLDCPSDLELGEFEMGFLEATGRGEEIFSHTAHCPHCLADLAQIRQYMALPLVDDSLIRSSRAKKTPFLEKVKVIFVDLLSPPQDLFSNVSFQPAMRGIQESMDTRVFQVDSYVIALSAVKNLSSWQKQQIIGDISPMMDEGESFQKWSAFLWRDGKLLATTPIGDDSHFIFDDIQFANMPHELILSGPKVEIHLQNLHMA